MPQKESLPQHLDVQEVNLAQEILRSSYSQVLRKTLTDNDDITAVLDWNNLRQSDQHLATAINLFEQLSAYRRLTNTQPFHAPTCREVLESQIPELRNKGRVGELLVLVAAGILGAKSNAQVSAQSHRVYQSLVNKPTEQGPINIIDLVISDEISFVDKLAWFSHGILPALQFLSQLDKKEAEKLFNVEVEKPSPTIHLEELNNFQPRDVRQPIAIGMSEPKEFELGKTSIHFTVTPYSSGYYRTAVCDTWDDSSLSFTRGNIQMQPLIETTLSASPLTKTIQGVLPAGKLIGIPRRFNYQPISCQTESGEPLPVFVTAEDDYLLDGTHFSSSAGFVIKIDKVSCPLDKPRAESSPTIINDFSQYDLSPGLLQLLKNWLQGSQNIDQLAGQILHFIKTNLVYSTDKNISDWYKLSDKKQFFARIEQAKQADCDVASAFYICLLGKCGIQARLIDGYYVDRPHVSGTAVLGSHNPHAWVEYWNGNKWIEADPTPCKGSSDDVEKGDTEKQPDQINEDQQEMLGEMLSPEEIEQIIQEALEELERQKREEQEKIEQFAKDAGCDTETARKTIRRLEEARLKKDKQGRLLQTRMRNAWLQLERRLEKPKPRKRKARLSDGEELDDEEELMLDLAVRETDPGGFIKIVKKTIYQLVFDALDVFLVGDKSKSMQDIDETTGQPKKNDQQTLGFLLLDSLHAASQRFARKLGKPIGAIEIRSCLVTFGACDPQSGRMMNSTVNLPLSNAWSPKEQVAAFRALEENFGGSTPDYSGLQVVRNVIDEDQKRRKESKKRLRLVLLITDGGSDSVSEARKEKDRLEESGHTLRVVGIGEDAVQVPKTYPGVGTHLSSFDEVYGWLTDEVVAAINKLSTTG